jgi:hypothetical protein
VSEDDVALGIIRVVRCDHSRDRLTDHYIADLKWLGIRFPVIHAAPHVRIQRKILHSEQNLSGIGAGIVASSTRKSVN